VAIDFLFVLLLPRKEIESSSSVVALVRSYLHAKNDLGWYNSFLEVIQHPLLLLSRILTSGYRNRSLESIAKEVVYWKQSRSFEPLGGKNSRNKSDLKQMSLNVLIIDGVEHWTSGLIDSQEGKAVEHPWVDFFPPVCDNTNHDL
jgi:hypothetical protein